MSSGLVFSGPFLDASVSLRTTTMVRALLRDYFFHDALSTDRGARTHARRRGDHDLTRVELGAKAKLPLLMLLSQISNTESQTAVQVLRVAPPPFPPLSDSPMGRA